MAYLAIFAACYALALALIAGWQSSLNSKAADRLRATGATDEAVRGFLRTATPPILLVRPVLLFGTAGGVLASLVYRLAA